MDISAMNFGFPYILIHILNILLYVAIAAVIGILIVRYIRKQRSKV